MYKICIELHFFTPPHSIRNASAKERKKDESSSHISPFTRQKSKQGCAISNAKNEKSNRKNSDIENLSEYTYEASRTTKRWILIPPNEQTM